MRRACWQWPALLELLGQDCMFLVGKGWGLPTTEPVWGYSHTCSEKLPGGAHVTQGHPEGQNRRPWEKEAEGTPGVLLSKSQTEVCL